MQQLQQATKVATSVAGSTSGMKHAGKELNAIAV